jgi:glycerophosphoryl diester phosphodiesterase
MPFFSGRRRPGSPYLAGAPLLIAHRGGAALAPENTLTAFRQAVEWWGADILEIDVHATADGEAVVIHDATLDRTTDATGPVAALRLDRIRELDAGYRFTGDGGRSHPYRDRDVRIPTLREVLEAFPGQRVNVEIKDPRAAPRTREILTELAAEGRVLLAAERRAARRAAGSWRGATSASGEELRRFYLLHRAHLAHRYRPCVDALQLPHRYYRREIPTARFVRDAHALKLAVHVWTVDRAADMRRLLENGVDGIVTDRPDRLARVLHERVGRALPPGPATAEMMPFLERLLLVH